MENKKLKSVWTEYIEDEQGKKIAAWNIYHSFGKIWRKNFFKNNDFHCQFRKEYDESETLTLETIFIR